MNKTGYSRVVTALGGILGVCWSCGQVTQADFTYGTPTKVPNVNSAAEDSQPQISRDGLELYFLSDRGDSKGESSDNIWVARRSTVRDPWSAPVKLDAPVNTAGPENAPSLSADGFELYFSNSWFSEPASLYVSTRTSKTDPWGPPVKLAPPVNSENKQDCPCISADGLSLYFMSNRPGGTNNPSNSDIFVTTRRTKDAPWGEPEKLGPNVNSDQYEYTPWISPDGLSLFFSRGFSKAHVFVCRRKSATDPWGPAEFFAPVNSGTNVWATGPAGAEWNLSFAQGDPTLYFSRASDLFSNDFDLWQVVVTPVVDFNGDGKVDEKDFLVMAQHWGQEYSRCDIGPRPLGDGNVDVQDLMVFLETMVGRDIVFSPRPHASDVPPDATLAWTSPPFANAHDVYLGTSFTDVNTASRSQPKGVLVSQGQTATTYDPKILMAPGRTYYWRIDEEIPGARGFTVCRGPVSDFKIAPGLASPLTQVVTTASGAQVGMGPEKTVDGSGLTGEQHGVEATTMWLSTGALPNWIQYQFDKGYQLHELWVWNSNQSIEGMLGFGARKVTIEYSVDGTTWTPLANVPEFARAPGLVGYTPNTVVSFGGVSARYVKLTITSTCGGLSVTGLTEVRFFCTQAAKP